MRLELSLPCSLDRRKQPFGVHRVSQQVSRLGHDGHRGWVYYLAVDERHRSTGLGRRLISAAETWLQDKGAVKVQLMVRAGNTAVLGFYDNLGYEDADVQVFSKWLNR